MPVLAKHSHLRFVRENREIDVNVREVDSSNVDSIAWPVTGEPLMIVTYRNGGVYGYLGVSRQRAVAAAYASSTGSYINARIKGHFKPVKL
jgi:hypothetical protein